MERVVVALGGNALLRRGADDTFEEMYRAARAAAEQGVAAERHHDAFHWIAAPLPQCRYSTGRKTSSSCGESGSTSRS